MSLEIEKVGFDWFYKFCKPQSKLFKMWSISSFVNIVWIRDNSWFYLPEIIFLRKTAFQDFDPQILGVKFKYFLLNLFLINQENSVFSINNLIFSWTDIFLNSNIFLDSKVTYSPLPDITESARYILVLFIKSLANPRCYSFVRIATNGVIYVVKWWPF